jgi:hypothetical protein
MTHSSSATFSALPQQKAMVAWWWWWGWWVFPKALEPARTCDQRDRENEQSLCKKGRAGGAGAWIGQAPRPLDPTSSLPNSSSHAPLCKWPRESWCSCPPFFRTEAAPRGPVTQQQPAALQSSSRASARTRGRRGRDARWARWAQDVMRADDPSAEGVGLQPAHGLLSVEEFSFLLRCSRSWARSMLRSTLEIEERYRSTSRRLLVMTSSASAESLRRRVRACL